MEQRGVPARKGSPCPRCGEPISWLKVYRVRYEDRVYEYLTAVHYYGYEDGRKKERKCYLGPADIKRILESMKSLARRALSLCDALKEEPEECTVVERVVGVLESTNKLRVNGDNIASATRRG
ncbi:MAG: hypothetical protein QXF18_04510 [Acidilobaceae archaeon]